METLRTRNRGVDSSIRVAHLLFMLHGASKSRPIS